MHSRRILTACLAALLLGACSEKPSTPAPRPVAPAPRAPITSVPDASTAVLATPDAGAEVAQVDPIALEHAHRNGVDHLARADRLREEGDIMGALAEARRAVADAPEDPDALQQVAKLAGLAQRHEVVADAWSRLAELQPDDAAPAIRHARALLQLKDYAAAALSALDAIARDPQNPEAYQAAGRAYLSSGELAAAITMFEKVIELDPDHGYALNNLGLAYLRTNRNEDAVEVLTRAADLLPTVAFVHNNLGVAYERVGAMEQAKGAYALASSLSPKYVNAQVNRARLRTAAYFQAETGSGEDLQETEVEAVDVGTPALPESVPAME